MNRDLRSNLENKTSVLKVANESKKQGRGMFRFFLMAVLAFFLNGTIFGQATEISTLEGLNGMSASGNYVITDDINATNYNPTMNDAFTGTLTARAKADGTFPVISGLTKPLFETVTGAHISNIMLKNVAISQSGNVGAIACTANGASRIYNCGILPDGITYDANGVITGTGSTVASSNGYCGSLVGELAGNARVINCFSYAFITGGTTVAGLVGYIGNTEITQTNVTTVPMVVNCMFYGDITGGTTRYPVYGGAMIKTDSPNHTNTGVNPYDFFREDATFDNSYLTGNANDINKYNRSWPVMEEYLTRFEYYRSIFNSNRRLCTYWVTGKQYGSATNAPTAEDEALIAKWVLDPSIAPYPILKKWGKYPSIINPDPSRTWNPEANNGAGGWQSRSSAAPYRGKSHGTLSVTVMPGNHAATAVQTAYGTNGKSLSLTITDMDTLNHDYGFYKVQLPYYNELFGNPSSNDHDTRYGGNYKDYVVTGWKITGVGTDGTITDYNHFEANWEHGYNFADRYCTDKDLYSVSNRVFAQGGYYYVPEGVTTITIEAYWGKAIYLNNTGHYIDRVDITNYSPSGNPQAGQPFEPAGKVPETFQNQTVYQSWQSAVLALGQATNTNGVLDISVYDQAIVLLNNFQWRNENHRVGTNIEGGTNRWFPYTIMSIDRDLDNEPDYCFELQFRREFARPGIQPIRFDFLPVPELGMAVRHNKNTNTIGIFVPQGHFEITETSYMHTTQFEYDANVGKVEAPVILNGGHFEQIVIRYGSTSSNSWTQANKTSYILMGGHFRMLRFTPGAHTNPRTGNALVRLCAVNAIGGEYPEFYLSGIYRPDINPGNYSYFVQGNPHCYINGGKYDFVAGAGYDKILGNVSFKIDHAIIGEFYGGGINGSQPIGGNIDVTINNSLVEKYCGGPKIGAMTNGKTVTTHATGTVFGRFYGGGNGGTSYYREQKEDGNIDFTDPSTLVYWNGHGYGVFNPLNTISGTTAAYEGPNTTLNRGYHALFEFECFVESNGLGDKPTIRSYLHWAQFGTTTTGDVTNILTDCTVKKNFYGGGNLANVNGKVTSTLTDCTIMGNAFGGGYSGRIEPFRIHDKSHPHFPYTDGAGIMHDGLNRLNSLDYIDREYTWCYKNATTGEMFPQGVVIPENANTGANATFEYDGKWYVLTTVSLEHLGAVSKDVTLTLKGTTEVGHYEDGNLVGGDVFGGGDESEVDENTTVNLQDGVIVRGNVYGGGNEGKVGGDSKVRIQDESNATTEP